MSELSSREQEEVRRANDSGRRPVLFLHGLWLLASSWEPWRARFEREGYVTLAPGWPDEPETVEEARRHSERLAGLRIGPILDHLAAVIARLRVVPAIIGHSFGGLFAQQLAGRGLSAATVAIDPAPFRGVLPLPLSALRAGFPVLRNPANYSRAVALSFDEFRSSWANTLSLGEARELFDRFLVAAPGAPLFQAAAANLNPTTEARVDTRSPRRGPLLLVAGMRDHTVPWAMVSAAYRRQRRNPGVTEVRQIGHRGHSLIIDSGWPEVADAALAFVQRHDPSTLTVRPHEAERQPEATP